MGLHGHPADCECDYCGPKRKQLQSKGQLLPEEQPPPKDGQTVVMPELKNEFLFLLEERWRVGVERYGKPLQTFNGRDAGRDAVEEWFDLGIYLKQLRMEHEQLLTALGVARQCLEAVLQRMYGSDPSKTLVANALQALNQGKPK